MLGKLTLLQKLILLNGIQGGSSILETVTGTLPLALQDAINHAIVSLTRYGAIEQRNIPASYTELEYVTMPASSYISNTSITILPTYKVEFEFETGTLGSSLANIFGGRRSGSTAGNGIRLTKLANKGVAMYGFDSTNAYESSAGVLSDNTRYKFVYDSGVITLYDGTGTVVATQTYTPDDTEGTPNWAINGYYVASASSNSDSTKWVSLRIWDNNGSLIVDYVSAKNSNAVGMYDSVSDTLVTATAGTFTAGPALTPSPERSMDIWCNNGVITGYRRLSYIESHGTEYIDTGIYLNTAFKYEIVVASVNGNNASNIWGYKSNNSYTGGKLCIIGWTGSSPTYIGAYNKNGNIVGSFPAIDGLQWTAGKFFDIVMDVTHSHFIVDGTDYYSEAGVSTVLTTDSWTDTRHPYLFGTQTVATAVPAQALRIKSYRVYNGNGTLVQNFVPAQYGSTVGMYDTVSGEFFKNKGTGSFTAGTDLGPLVVGTPEVLTVTGKNLLDSTPIKTGYYIDGNGVEQYATNDPEQYHIRQGKVMPSTQYTVSFKATNSGYTQRFHAYTADGTWISQVAAIDSSGADPYKSANFTTPANCAYIRQGGRDQSEYQLELGSTPTAYEPYTAQTASVPMLLGVGDDKDTAEIIGGLQTHKVGIKVLTGDEDIGKSGIYSGSFFIRNVVSNWGTFNSAPLLCTRLVSVTSDSNYAVGKCMVLNNALNLWLWDDNTHQIADAQNELASAYASGNPYIVIYPLATETTEQTTAQPLVTYEGTNVVDSTANVSPVEMKAEYYKKSR